MELLTISFIVKDSAKETTMKEVLAFIRHLKYFEAQIMCVQEILKSSTEEELTAILQSYSCLDQFALNLNKKSDINEKMLAMVDSFVREHMLKRTFRRFSEAVPHIKKGSTQGEQEFLHYMANMVKN